MTSFIIIVVIALFFVLVGYTWYRLEAYEGMERVIFCVAGILVCWGITTILFNISSSGMDYISVEVEHEISKILVMVFTPINGLVLMPNVARIVSRLKFDEIEKSKAIKQFVILGVIFVVVSVIEVMYLTNIQLGILDVASKM